MKYQVDEKGFYGDFGGAYIPEMLYPNVEELRQNYIQISESESFQKEFQSLLSDYVGRPTPLYLASRLSEKYNTRIYLKREDLCVCIEKCTARCVSYHRLHTQTHERMEIAPHRAVAVDREVHLH